MRERGGKTKAINISGIDDNTLHKAIHDNVSRGSTIYTDELRGYRGIGGTSYKHERVNSQRKRVCQWQGHINGIESVWAVIMAYIITETANTGQNTSMNLHFA